MWHKDMTIHNDNWSTKEGQGINTCRHPIQCDRYMLCNKGHIKWEGDSSHTRIVAA